MRERFNHVLEHLTPWRWLNPMILGAAVGVLVALGAGGWLVARTQQAFQVRLADKASVRVDGPLRVDFTQEIAPGFQATIEPKVAGSWGGDQTFLGVSGISFKPAKRFEAGHTYKVRLSGLKRVATGAALPDVVQTFTAQAPAAVTSTQPAIQSKDVSIRPQFMVKLAAANRGVRQLVASLTPAVPLKLAHSDDQTFVWEPQTPLKQGTAYTFVLEDTHLTAAAERTLVTVPFTTVAQPGITSARTGGLFSPGQTVDIVFDQAMKTDADGFSFDVKGKGKWADDHTYRFTPEELRPGTTYNYVVKAGLASKVGGVVEADHPFQFATNGAVTASLGTGGTVGLSTPIRVTFDQPVDHGSAESRFSLSPGAAGKFSWSGNTMTYAPDHLEYQTGYSYSVAAGVVPVWGLPSTRAFSRSFTTETQVIKLNVPAYKQAFGRSCELSSLRMLLAYRGINVSDWDILMRLNYNPRPRDTATNSWDNPNEMFVGRVDTYSWSQGYGVHAGPVAAAARSFGRSASSYSGISAAFISGQIHAGNPVEFYGHISPPRLDAWNTSSGVVQTTTSMHARVVYGVVGRADAPVGFYVIDPWTGAREYWSAGQLIANMNDALPISNQAVVVF